jgi:uridylate kinase
VRTAKLSSDPLKKYLENKNLGARGADKSLDSRKRIVIKISGSVFSSTADLTEYGRMFSAITNKVQPVVVAGGGKVARDYIDTARRLGLDEASLDIMGIEVSRLNAKLLSAAIGSDAATYHSIPHDLEQVSAAVSSRKIVITGGLHPGQSTNATAALIAEKVNAKLFLNATDVEGIYDLDPKRNPKAKMFKEITIPQCIEILRHENAMAGAYDLMDIVALKVIERSKIPTVVLKTSAQNIKSAIEGKQIGTQIVAS